ncbi:MAG: hypothetical protein WD266_12215 [Balneolales bacterium]
MSHSTVRRIFIFFLVFLPVQYGFVGLAGHLGMVEPWPALVFPGFKNVYDGEEGITLVYSRLSVILADSSRQAVPVPEFLRAVPHSHHRAIMAGQFNAVSAKNLNAETRSWVYNRLRTETGRTDIIRLDIEWINKFYQVQNREVITRTETLSRDHIYFDEKI